MAKKRKPLTKREKVERAEIKKALQEKSVLPPDKPRLNRSKFARDVFTEFDETMGSYGDTIYIMKAIGCMVSKDMRKVTPEEVGVLKLLKLAIESKKFSRALAEQGRSEYTVGEYYDEVVKPVISL